MDVTISQAAKMAGVSRATIYNDIDAGVLSVVTGVKNRKMINVAELERVYKKLNILDETDESGSVKNYQDSKSSKVTQTDQVAVLQERIESLKRENELLHDLIEKEREDRKREREVVVNFEEYFKNQLENQAENLSVFTKLLEDQRQSKDQRQERWENSMKALEQRISNSESKSYTEISKVKKRAHKEIQRYKKALQDEKSKTIFERIFRA